MWLLLQIKVFQWTLLAKLVTSYDSLAMMLLLWAMVTNAWSVSLAHGFWLTRPSLCTHESVVSIYFSSCKPEKKVHCQQTVLFSIFCRLIVPRDKFSISLKRTEENRLAHRNESKRRTNNSKSQTNNVTEDKDMKGIHLFFKFKKSKG